MLAVSYVVSMKSFLYMFRCQFECFEKFLYFVCVCVGGGGALSIFIQLKLLF
jgi:hypothetical protein